MCRDCLPVVTVVVVMVEGRELGLVPLRWDAPKVRGLGTVSNKTRSCVLTGITHLGCRNFVMLLLGHYVSRA